MKLRLNQKPNCTTEQINYLQILFNDCGFNQISKQGLLLRDYGVKHIDELDIQQASYLITYMIKLKNAE